MQKINSSINLICSLIACLFLLIIGGCSYHVHSYNPTILKEGEGEIAIGQFSYVPYRQGKLKENQVDTDIFYRPIYTDDTMVDHVKNAVTKEFKLIGYKINPDAPKVLTGEILEYSCKMLGTSYDVLVKIKFVVTQTKDGKQDEIYSRLASGSFTQNKFRLSFEPLSISAILNEGLKNCINSFISEAQSRKILL